MQLLVSFFSSSVTFKDSLHPAATSRLPSNLQPLQFKDGFGCQVGVHPFTRSSLFNETQHEHRVQLFPLWRCEDDFQAVCCTYFQVML